VDEERRSSGQRCGGAGGIGSVLLYATLVVSGLGAGEAGAQQMLEGRVEEGVVPEITLDDAVRRAMGRNPQVVGASSNLSVAYADRRQAYGSFLPSINTSGFFNNSSNERFDQSTGRLSSTSYNAQTSGTLQLFSGGRRFAQIRARTAGVEAAGAQYREEEFGAALQVTEIFFGAAAAEELLTVARQRLVRAREQERFAGHRLEVGTATRSDVLRAELEVGNAELAVVDAEVDLRSQRLELGRQVGEEGPLRPVAGALPVAAPEIPPLNRLLAQVEQTGPSILAGEASRREARAQALTAYGSYLPSLQITGGWDWFGIEFPPDQRSWSLRLIASVPIFDGLQRESQIARAHAAEDAARARARDARLEGRVRVEAQVLEIERAERRVEISERSVEVAREDLRVQEERYQFGSATILELQTSQVALAEAETALVQDRQALGVAVVRLEAVMGLELERLSDGSR